MLLQKLIAWIGPLLYVVGAAWFVAVSDRGQRKPVLVGWLVPGLGHWITGHRSRALFFGIQIVVLFVAGLAMADFRCISPLDRHPIWAITQIPGGLLTLVAAVTTAGLDIQRDNALYPVGCLYVGVACLLNLVALCDLYDLTEPASRRKAAERKAA